MNEYEESNELPGMRVAIHVAPLPEMSVGAQDSALRKLCAQRGWIAEPVRPHGERPRRVLIDELLRRRHDALAVWHIALLGDAIDDLLWCLTEVHVRRGIHLVAPGDGIDTTDTTADDSLKKVLVALAKVG
jgi:hypothetical protein